ncbi:DUF4383 domain-containing protein [Sporichthya polymorpha]|uniref:DUF4383 domain-containing protein n=1 Tax=Sporichthya polymorpha TaxID=35751 RepID=UPI00039A5B16|nr:DUF4383 domain-containing protein [Sporichthya polymorpha]
MRHGTSSPTVDRPGSEQDRKAHLLKLATTVVAATFLLVGVAGFIPGLTTNVDNLEIVGHDHANMGEQAELLGIFHVSVLHNIVHLAFGAVGLAMARSVRGASTYLVGGAIIYALVLVYGVVVDQESDANFLPVNTADNWLHGGLVVGMLALALALTPSRRSSIVRREDAND